MRNFAMLSVVCLFGACSTGDGGGGCPSDRPYVNDGGECNECLVSLDRNGNRDAVGCEAGESCFDGNCIPVSCVRHSDCYSDVTGVQNANGAFCDDNGECVPCLTSYTRRDGDSASASTREAVVDLGCIFGEQCDEYLRLCVPAEPACNDADGALSEDCPAVHPVCYRGFCVGCVEDANCPGFGSPDADTECTEGFVCETRDLEACLENADCNDANPCTRDICTVGNVCEYPASLEAPGCPLGDNESSEGEAEAEAEAEGEDPPGSSVNCTLTWGTPNAESVDRVTMYASSGPDGAATSMNEIGTRTNAAGISLVRNYGHNNVTCVSVTYVVNGMTRYSCQANTTYGPMSAVCGGSSRNLTVYANGLGGCNRCFVVP